MGFPLGYNELLLPKSILQIFFFISFFLRLITLSINAVGLRHFLDSDASLQEPSDQSQNCMDLPDLRSITAALIQEMIPSIRFEDLLSSEVESDLRAIKDGCAVCLQGFEAGEEIRRLSNCCHVFHQNCIDRWIEHDQQTCPLCRSQLVPEEMMEGLDCRIWAAVGFSYLEAADDLCPLDSLPQFSFSASSLSPLARISA